MVNLSSSVVHRWTHRVKGRDLIGNIIFLNCKPVELVCNLGAGYSDTGRFMGRQCRGLDTVKLGVIQKMLLVTTQTSDAEFLNKWLSDEETRDLFQSLGGASEMDDKAKQSRS